MVKVYNQDSTLQIKTYKVFTTREKHGEREKQLVIRTWWRHQHVVEPRQYC